MKVLSGISKETAVARVSKKLSESYLSTDRGESTSTPQPSTVPVDAFIPALQSDLPQPSQVNLAAVFKALELRESPAEKNIRKANQLLSAERFSEAVLFCTDLIKANPREVRAYAGRGEAYRQLGKLDESVTDFLEALQNQAIYPYPLLVYRSLGLVFWRQGKFVEALEYFAAIAQSDHYNPLAWVLMAQMKALLGEKEQSQQYLEYGLACRSRQPNPFESFFEPQNESCFSACVNGDIEPAYRFCKVKLCG